MGAVGVGGLLPFLIVIAFGLPAAETIHKNGRDSNGLIMVAQKIQSILTKVDKQPTDSTHNTDGGNFLKDCSYCDIPNEIFKTIRVPTLNLTTPDTTPTTIIQHRVFRRLAGQFESNT
jgi:hypothetical protein